MFGFLKKLFAPAEDPKTWVARGAKIIDVRSPGEFASGHAPGAVNIPLDQFASSAPKKFKDKNQEFVLCCASGNRSGMAKSIMEQKGYTKVLNGGPWTRLRAWIAGLLVLASTGMAAQNLDVATFERESKKGTVVDVRTPGEVAEGMIAGAKHVDFYDAQFMTKMAAFPKDKPLYLYCRSGGRSGQALAKLKAAGYTKVYHLQGGIGAWMAARRPVVKK
ncbi:MAG: rhodanese-like domain-containing protein [Schleiferiaceae bacterium]